jgi:hypothetical protein
VSGTIQPMRFTFINDHAEPEMALAGLLRQRGVAR